MQTISRRRVLSSGGLPSRCTRSSRYLATEATSESSASALNDVPPPTGSVATTKRPREWSRPLANGVIKAYDEAVALIRHDSNLKMRELHRVQKEMEGADASLKKGLEGRLQKLQIESQINLPEIRWQMKEGLGQYT